MIRLIALIVVAIIVLLGFADRGHARKYCTWGASSIWAEKVHGKWVVHGPYISGCTKRKD
jgi:hypothetical protein